MHKVTILPMLNKNLLHMFKSFLMHKNINQCKNIVTSIYITPIVLFLCTDVTKVHL